MTNKSSFIINVSKRLLNGYNGDRTCLKPDPFGNRRSFGPRRQPKMIHLQLCSESMLSPFLGVPGPDGFGPTNGFK